MRAWEKIVDTVNENRIVVGSLAGFATAFMYHKIATQFAQNFCQRQNKGSANQ
jgi:hypothetical protein